MQSKFEQLYDMYYDSVYRYIYGSVKNKWNAEDIIVTVFTKIFEEKDKIIKVEESESWIFRIAHNAILNFKDKNNIENLLYVRDEDIVIIGESKGIKRKLN